MIHQSPPRKRFAGLIGATAATALAASILAPMAVASDVSTLPIVDPTQTTGQIYIYKYVDTPAVDQTANPNNGTELDTSGWQAQPVDGVYYQIYQVLTTSPLVGGTTTTPAFIELADAAGWQAAAAGEGVVFSAANGNLLTDGPVTMPNGDRWSIGSDTADTESTFEGLAQSVELPLGLYYVVEDASGTTSPVGVIASPDPFLVTLPMTNPDGTGWITDDDGYAVYVYPKNPISLPTKTVDSSLADSVGGTVTYTINSSLTAPGMASYVINDPIDARLTVQSVDLYYSNSSSSAVTIGSVTIPTGDTEITDTSFYDITDGTDALTFGADPAAPATVGDPGTNLTITFTPDGVADLKAHSQDINPVTLKVVITTTVNSNLNTQTAAGGDAPDPGILSPIEGYVPNIGSAIIDNSTVFTNATDADPTGVDVYAYFGGVALHKQDGNTGDPITSEDATFRIFTSFAEAQAWTNTPANATASLQALDINGQPSYEFTTDSNGMAGILGLHYGTDATTPACTISSSTAVDISTTNGSQYNGDAVTGNEYWVVEVQAPEGYSLLAEPVSVCVVGVLDNSSSTSSYDDWWINNTKVNAGFDLPFTAWMGDHTVIVAVVLLVSGLAIYEIRRRRLAHAA